MNHTEIESFLRKQRPQKSQHNSAAYIGGGQSKLGYLGHRVPQLRNFYSEQFSFREYSSLQRLNVWHEVFKKSNCYEVMSLSLHWAETLSPDELIKAWPSLKKWSLRIDNWAHSDSLCNQYAKILEANPQVILPTLKTWNKSKNPWLVRISMVSLFYYARARQKFPSQKIVENFISHHWDHEHYYVQKAIGWTLRESITASPQLGLEFLKKNILKVSGIAFTAATERLSMKEKFYLKQVRKTKKK